MATLEDITKKWLNDRRRDIITRQKRRGMRASGRTAASLEVVEKGESLNLIGAASFVYQEDGRGPTKKAGRVPLYVIIRQWMKDKGLTKDKSFNEYAIANKIHKEGTRLYRKKEKGLEIDQLTRDNLPKLQDDLALSLRDRVTSDILKRFKDGGYNT